MNNLEKIKDDFLNIKSKGYINCTRNNNEDGGIGNTFEDLLGVTENNLKLPDYLGYEIKSKRLYNQSYISLFSKSPSYPKKANSFLRETFGEERDPLHPYKKKLYASIFGHRESEVYGKYRMKLHVNYDEKKIQLIIKDLNNNILNDNIYWTFDAIEKATFKMKSLMLVLADTKTEDGQRKYHYNNAEIYSNFSLENFLKNIECGGIMFDIRIGVYSSGKNIGKTHDHGSGFRVKRENFNLLYESFVVI
jgi:hypothetical protein